MAHAFLSHGILPTGPWRCPPRMGWLGVGSVKGEGRMRWHGGTERQWRLGVSENTTEGAVGEAAVDSVGPPRTTRHVGGEDTLEVKTLRDVLKARDSPFAWNDNAGGGFVDDDDKVNLHSVKLAHPSPMADCDHGIEDMAFDEDLCYPLPQYAVRSGPRKTIYFEPSEVSAAVVTCGGLCPGLNDVIQSIVSKLVDYGVAEDNIIGIQYGLRGFYDPSIRPITLHKELVNDIHLRGGTMLGTSRGGADVERIVKRIDLWGLNMLFVVGGKGGNAAANAIQEECERRGVVCAVVAVPKSIDNDILIVDKCFGYDTACDEAQRALLAAKVEARSTRRGVGLVKLMGRNSGFIATKASMSSGVVDICLIPEIPVNLGKLLSYVETVLQRQGHCVICVAEGCGQDLLGKTGDVDASGNPILKDIGPYLKEEIKRYFEDDVDVKYIDPTYMIRAIVPISSDRVYCKILGQGAVHSAFAAYTGITVGLINTHFAYLPIPDIIQAPRRINPRGRRWNRLKTAINQPDFV
ncbi:unnamed protein product [Ostreobium quekettii]|uniref:Phosphofructokinase domain-containing protein n=1 Tax=Ostreobium quekettii TaxID=121088 RepID=A0A8S1J738_9CHLO|nr:unnamed protein product [Ostreobium quekettii]|eukprot:evm.model.scf_1670.1 EVM.evm.TU.scf_1670.1   scf_1670:494-10796(+)